MKQVKFVSHTAEPLYHTELNPTEVDTNISNDIRYCIGVGIAE